MRQARALRSRVSRDPDGEKGTDSRPPLVVEVPSSRSSHRETRIDCYAIISPRKIFSFSRANVRALSSIFTAHCTYRTSPIVPIRVSFRAHITWNKHYQRVDKSSAQTFQISKDGLTRSHARDVKREVRMNLVIP